MTEVIFPEYEAVENALLLFLAEKGPSAPKDVYRPLAEQFGLTAEHLAVKRDGFPNASLWENRVQWSRQRLKNHGYLGPQLRVWELSKRGLKAAAARQLPLTSPLELLRRRVGASRDALRHWQAEVGKPDGDQQQALEVAEEEIGKLAALLDQWLGDTAE